MNNKKDTRYMVTLALMAAIVILLANTPLGMIQLPIIKATTVHIPVIIGSIVLGPAAGAFLGAVFGVCSMISNTQAPTLLSFAFSPFLSTTGLIGVIKALWVSIGCRVMIGVVSGWVSVALKKLSVPAAVRLAVTGFIGSMTNTVFVMGSIYLLFAQQYAEVKNVGMEAVFGLVMGTVAASGVPEAIAAAILVTAITGGLMNSMLFAIDIGNTNMVIGCIDGDKILFSERLSTDHSKTALEYALAFKNVLDLHGIDRTGITGAIIASVVPPITAIMTEALGKIMSCNVKIVGPGLRNGLKICMDNPAQVGADLIVAAVAGVRDYPCPLILIDMGTATTITVVDKDKNYRGGMILPGLRVSGTNTNDCMKSGILYGSASMLDGMIERIEDEIGMKTTVVATGGLANAIVPLCKHEIIPDDDLLLRGLRYIYERNS